MSRRAHCGAHQCPQAARDLLDVADDVMQAGLLFAFAAAPYLLPCGSTTIDLLQVGYGDLRSAAVEAIAPKRCRRVRAIRTDRYVIRVRAKLRHVQRTARESDNLRRNLVESAKSINADGPASPATDEGHMRIVGALLSIAADTAMAIASDPERLPPITVAYLARATNFVRQAALLTDSCAGSLVTATSDSARPRQSFPDLTSLFID